MARNSEQNEKMREERKVQILKEALKQFAEKGLSATKIQDIAKGVGMAQGLIYHYYSSKEEIYVMLIHEALDKLNAATFALRDLPEAPHIKIEKAIIEMLKTIETSKDFSQTCRLIAQATNSSALPEEDRKQIDKKREVPYKIFSEIMAKGQGEGTIVKGDPEELAMVFWTSINGLAIYKASREVKTKMPSAEIFLRQFLV